MKQIITITTAVILLICFSTVQAHADRKTMEGFMLGTGVAILGAAIISGINNDRRPQYARQHIPPAEVRHIEYREAYRHNYPRNYRHHGPSGHWEITRIWVAPVYENKWNPGHYNHRGEWIDGRYEQFLISEGFWQEQKVWVRH